MQIKDGASVYTADGKDVGKIDRVVLDPHTNEITHVVVRKGWLFTEDKVVPMGLIDSANEDQVRLRSDVEDLDDLPVFEETYYVSNDEMVDERMTGSAAAASAGPIGYAPGLYWYPPMGAAWPGYYGGAYGRPLMNYVGRTEQNVPEGTVALKEGADVYSSDDEHVGKIEEVITNADLNRATHLLITEGWLFKEKRVIPVDRIRDVTEESIRLGVTSSALERIPAHE